MRRILLALSLAGMGVAGGAVAALGLAGAETPSIGAYPICVGAGYQSSVIGDGSIGPVCESYPDAVTCDTGTEGLSPTLVITHEVCVPAP
jgi:hypothetical protein